jgi:hypothetical protein
MTQLLLRHYVKLCGTGLGGRCLFIGTMELLCDRKVNLDVITLRYTPPQGLASPRRCFLVKCTSRICPVLYVLAEVFSHRMFLNSTTLSTFDPSASIFYKQGKHSQN